MTYSLDIGPEFFFSVLPQREKKKEELWSWISAKFLLGKKSNG